MALTPEQIAQFDRDGILLIPNYFTKDETAELRAAALRAIEEAEVPDSPSIFTSDEQTRTTDRYFLESSTKVRAFFEKGALNSSKQLVVPKHLGINKLGHDLHTKVPEFRRVSLEDARVKDLLRSLGYECPVVPQSMLILKPPSIGGAVNPHQDGSFLYTEPQSVLGLWWNLEPCRKSNSCLWAVPGSHKRGVKRRFRRTAEGAEELVFDPPEAENFDISGAVALEIPEPGGLVLIHSSVVHFSDPNTSDESRHAYSIHVIESGKGVVYPKDNWLQRDDGEPFPAVY